MSSLIAPEIGNRDVSVRVVTLDDVCEERQLHPDALKIDVEGYELEVLRGFRRTLSRQPPPLILVELGSSKEEHAQAMALLLQHGYQAGLLLDDGSTRPISTTNELPAVQELVAFTLAVDR
jgi:hypothetical protein